MDAASQVSFKEIITFIPGGVFRQVTERASKGTIGRVSVV